MFQRIHAAPPGLVAIIAGAQVLAGILAVALPLHRIETRLPDGILPWRM
jgi:hypothetical protein